MKNWTKVEAWARIKVETCVRAKVKLWGQVKLKAKVLGEGEGADKG